MESTLDSSTTENVVDMGMHFFLITTIFNLGGMWMDVFIVAVNCRDWMKKKCLGHTDRILTFQGGIRICHGCVGMLWCTLTKFCPWIIQAGYVLKIFRFSSWYLITCNFWLTASLCSYYCVKIADFRHPFFIRLKLRLSRLVLPWLLGSMVLSLASSLPTTYSDLVLSCNSSLSHSFQNKTVSDTHQIRMPVPLISLLGLGTFAAFTICATSAILLLFSLWRHRQRMLGHWDGNRSPQNDAHFQALIIILFRLVNNTVLFVSILLMMLTRYEGNCTATVACLALLYTCFSVESLISLCGNKKLKNKLCGDLYFAKCRVCAT